MNKKWWGSGGGSLWYYVLDIRCDMVVITLLVVWWKELPQAALLLCEVIWFGLPPILPSKNSLYTGKSVVIYELLSCVIWVIWSFFYNLLCCWKLNGWNEYSEVLWSDQSCEVVRGNLKYFKWGNIVSCNKFSWTKNMKILSLFVFRVRFYCTWNQREIV